MHKINNLIDEYQSELMSIFHEENPEIDKDYFEDQFNNWMLDWDDELTEIYLHEARELRKKNNE